MKTREIKLPCPKCSSVLTLYLFPDYVGYFAECLSCRCKKLGDGYFPLHTKRNMVKNSIVSWFSYNPSPNCFIVLSEKRLK